MSQKISRGTSEGISARNSEKIRGRPYETIHARFYKRFICVTPGGTSSEYSEESIERILRQSMKKISN